MPAFSTTARRSTSRISTAPGRHPIVADAANNLVHALDQVLAACAKIHGSERHRSRYYPMASNDDQFERQLGLVSAYVGQEQLAAFRHVREKHKPWLPHLNLVKELSNNAKHWRLTPTTATAHGVGFVDQRRRRFVDIPAGHFAHHDTFELWRSADRPEPAGFETLVGFQFDGLDTDVAADPGAVFALASRYMLDVIEASEKVLSEGTA